MYAESISSSNTNLSQESSEITDQNYLNLTTQNSESGRAQIAQMQYYREGNSYIVTATSDDRGTKPDWFLNLKKEPLVQLEIDGIQFHARAKTPTGRERVRLLPKARKLAPEILDTIPRKTSLVTLNPLC